ncbi:hypothetical protein NUW58_g7406 [Xylaria curta]|uniref:Uncharacterized protein n=1 Tax=Xylaria curta TaxID=42375 RepID=A0ACC1NII5_9PEZI|nr:hypothetical protein NUW58_g7406 [Xylaria curta]
MRVSTSSLLLVAASAAQGVVIPKDVSEYIWDITQYKAGLYHGNPALPITSWYAFTVSGPRYESLESGSYIPAFGASCTGDGAGFPLSSDYSECTIDPEASEAGGSVLARIVPVEGSSQAHIAINYIFSNVKELDGARSDGLARLRPPANFTLSPSEVL